MIGLVGARGLLQVSEGTLARAGATVAFEVESVSDGIARLPVPLLKVAPLPGQRDIGVDELAIEFSPTVGRALTQHANPEWCKAFDVGITALESENPYLPSAVATVRNFDSVRYAGIWDGEQMDAREALIASAEDGAELSVEWADGVECAPRLEVICANDVGELEGLLRRGVAVRLSRQATWDPRAGGHTRMGHGRVSTDLAVLFPETERRSVEPSRDGRRHVETIVVPALLPSMLPEPTLSEVFPASKGHLLS